MILPRGVRPNMRLKLPGALVGRITLPCAGEPFARSLSVIR